MSWCRAQSGTFDQRFFFKVTVLSFGGALSDERSAGTGWPSYTPGRWVLMIMNAAVIWVVTLLVSETGNLLLAGLSWRLLPLTSHSFLFHRLWIWRRCTAPKLRARYGKPDSLNPEECNLQASRNIGVLLQLRNIHQEQKRIDTVCGLSSFWIKSLGQRETESQREANDFLGA
jgi:hypothetical protein